MVLPDSHGICVVEGGSPSWMAHLPGPRDTASGSRQMAYTLAALYGTTCACSKQTTRAMTILSPIAPRTPSMCLSVSLQFVIHVHPSPLTPSPPSNRLAPQTDRNHVFVGRFNGYWV